MSRELKSYINVDDKHENIKWIFLNFLWKWSSHKDTDDF